MFATTGRLAVRRRRQRCSTPPAIERPSIPSAISRAMAGILQADAYAGYGRLYDASEVRGPLTQALCWCSRTAASSSSSPTSPSARRGKNAAPISPMALEAVKRIDALFDIEREINGRSPKSVSPSGRSGACPFSPIWRTGCATERARLSRHAPVAKAMDYMLTRWEGFARFTTDGRICLTNNAAERAIRGLALGRKSWLFAGSDRGADRCAFMLTLIATAKLNDIDPQAWLADVLARIADIPQSRLGELLPWNWPARAERIRRAAA